MASQQQIYETKIMLNSEQAKKEINALEKKVEDLKRKRQDALNAGDSKSWQKLNKEVDKHEAKLKGMRNRLDSINKTLSKMSAAGPKQLKETIKDINALLNSGAIERGSRQWEVLTASLKQANTELVKIKNETKASQTAWQKFTKFLNDSWGGLAMIIGSISGITMTVRKTVEDYAKMEEAMADTRKYTGLADSAIRELNEDLKKMDTRTSRQELNELAGSAGRLGIDSKEKILEFVDAADKIKVALGDDLGEGAIDKVGKLAMAFGEDERMGLRGAMLATGSAVNELAQNSSAQAGYLVDFTARVAGFGKQLGLTQAQIMGFGAVMDENLLRDEMAATAFGNMLTKMQTDTEKFARIAGKDVKEFTDLLNRDANAAILALADNLRKADPQNMMKMLDDMGLDGSRAVGVLSTLADKIDDVRARQELATQAYKEATSVQKEYDTMNNTVEAGIEKAKKQFLEVSIALGEKLLPVVKYTITGTSMLIKAMLALIEGFKNYHATIITTSTALGILVLVRQKDIFFTKLQVLWNDRLIKGMRILWQLISKNPYAIAITAIALVIGLISDLTRRNQEAAKKTKELTDAQREQKAIAEDMKAVNEEVNRTTAEELTRFNQLRKTLEDSTKKYDDRKKALDEIKKIVPDYHGTLTTENTLINNNATALDNYVTSLITAARAQAAFNRMVNLQESSLQHEETLRQRQANQAWARQRLQQAGASEGTTFRTNMGGGYQMYNEQGEYVKTVTEAQKEQIEGYQRVIAYNDKRISQEQTILKTNQKQSETLQKVVEENGGVEKKTPPTKTTPYKSSKQEKKEEEDRKKREAEQKKALQEQSRLFKAETENRLAEEALNYSMGLTNYREYIEKRKQIQLEGIKQRKILFEQGSTEYLRLDAQEKQLLAHGDDEARKMMLKDYEAMHRDILRQLEMDFLTEGSAIYQNEDALREARFQEEMDFLENKKSLTRKGSLEQMQIEWEMQDRLEEHKLEKEREFTERLMQYRQEVGKMNYDQLMQVELKGVETMYGLLVKQGKMTKDEYDSIIEHVKRKYAELKGQQVANNDVQAKAASGLETAKKNAGVKENGAGDNAATGVASIANAIQNQKIINEQLKLLYGEDYENNREYQEAKRQLDAETMQQIVAGAQAAYSTISNFMSAASSYAQACSDLEVARITKNYDAQIAAAGNNEKKKEQLEKQKEKAIAKAKNEANKKAMKIEIAQAIASTALAALNAYASTAKIPVVGPALAPIAAGIAVAAGMLQVATIKKQHEAQSAGYYEGGFTGGNSYRKEAGVVHEGEFVANHQAVQNPAILPFLNFLDQAQRNNTVGSLTAEDVSRSIGTGGNSQIFNPIINIQNNNEELNDTLDEVRETMDDAKEAFKEGLFFDMDRFDKNYRHYNNLKKRP